MGKRLIMVSKEPDEMHGRSSVDYLLRTIQQSQVQFSQMADTKANSMFTVCSLVMSICITQLHHAEYRLPLLILIGFSVLALTAAVVGVIPSRIRFYYRNRPNDPEVNPFHFANYPSFDLPVYLSKMKETLAEDPVLYDTLLRDIYNQGYYLAAKKYRWIRFSYLLFIAGLFSSTGTLAVGLLAG
jgi:hypothetical protein